MESILKAQSMNEHLSQDQFLFSCKQALVARTSKKGFDSHLRFDPFLFGTYSPPQSKTVNAFRRELAEIFAHSFKETAQFRRQEQIDIETISFFSLAIATLIVDVESLLLAYSGIKLPCVQGVPRAVKDSENLPALAALFASYSAHALSQEGLSPDDAEPFNPFPLDEAGDASADATRVSEEFWGLIFSGVKKTFPDHHGAIVTFVRWHFQPEPEPIAIDWRVRPPVGEAFAQFLRSIQGSRAGAHTSRNNRFGGDGREGRGGRGGPSDGGGNRFGGDRDDRRTRGAAQDGGQRRNAQAEGRGGPQGPQGPRDEARSDRPARPALRETVNDRPSDQPASLIEGREEKATPSTRPTRMQTKPQRDAEDRPARRSASDTNAIDPEGVAGRSPEEAERLTEMATQEVERNIRILQKNSRRPGIRLKPQNSFFRRIQHMVAKEMGYDTESVGEGRDRAVFIKNK